MRLAWLRHFVILIDSRFFPVHSVAAAWEQHTKSEYCLHFFLDIVFQ